MGQIPRPRGDEPLPEGPVDHPGYPLLPHLLDVAAVAMELQLLVPCPVALPCSTEWLAALVGFHDLGKATPGFQLKLGSGAGQGFTFSAGAPDRHDASSVPLPTSRAAYQRPRAALPTTNRR